MSPQDVPVELIPTETIPTVIGFVVFLLLVTVSSAVWVWRERRAVKTGEASAADAIAQAATTLVAPLTARIGHLEQALALTNARVRQLEAEGARKDAKIEALTARIGRLEEQIRDLGHIPTP